MLGNGGRRYCFIQGDDSSTLNAFWVLWKNQSTVGIFYNGEILLDIHTITKSIIIHTNGGETVFNTAGCFPGYGRVW